MRLHKLIIGTTIFNRKSMQQKQLRQHTQRHSTGFSLVEVLVSIVVLSFGMLAMVGLQASALQSNREARMQSTATSLARELAEKMRGNHDVAILTVAANNPYLGDFSHPMAATTPTGSRVMVARASGPVGAISSYCLSMASAYQAKHLAVSGRS